MSDTLTLLELYKILGLREVASFLQYLFYLLKHTNLHGREKIFMRNKYIHKFIDIDLTTTF